MTKEEFLLSLPFHRKEYLYKCYLDYNKYYDEFDDEFDDSVFNTSIIQDIINIVDCNSSYFTNEEWETYKNL